MRLYDYFAKDKIADICISQVKRIIRICGFELEGRIVLKGKSGRIYK